MEFSGNLQQFEGDFEAALNGLTKLIKALNFYPADHPTLAIATEEAGKDIRPLLENHETYTYHVTQEGFSLNEIPLLPHNQNLIKLAVNMVERRIRHLVFLPNLTKRELLMFAVELSKPAEELIRSGGLAAKLEKQQITSIWINETNLDEIMKRVRESGVSLRDYEPQQTNTGDDHASPEQFAQIRAEEPTPSSVDRMRELLELLKEPQSDEDYEQLLNQLQLFSASFFETTGLAGQLAVFNLLDNHRRSRAHPLVQQQAAKAMVDNLLTEKICHSFVEAVADPKLKTSHRRALSRLLVSLGEKIAPQLLSRLYSERDAIVRRYYSDILAHMGEDIFDLLRNDLYHETWHVVRNVVVVLGNTRLESALPLLTQVLAHPDPRVRRSVIRALGAIGGNSVIPLLLKLVKDLDNELHHPAIMALGSLKNPLAIPPLVEILNKRDPFGKKIPLKVEVIQALAATKSPRAIIPLLKLARRLNLLNRNSLDILRAEAILALGQLGNQQLIPILQSLPKTDKAPISRALQQATAHLRKHQDVA